MARCTTCYGLNRGKLSGTSTDTQRARHDFWILLKSLAKMEKAAQAGCDVCDVLSSGLLAAIDAKDKVSLNARNVQVEIMIPRPKYNRVRVVARRSSPARVLADLEFYGSSRCKYTITTRPTQTVHSFIPTSCHSNPSPLVRIQTRRGHPE